MDTIGASPQKIEIALISPRSLPATDSNRQRSTHCTAKPPRRQESHYSNFCEPKSGIEKSGVQGSHAPPTRRNGAFRPLLIAIPEARRQLGGIGNTAFYDAVKRHSIKLVKIGSRSLVPMSEIERVVAELVTAANDRAEAQAKAVELAKKSVAARRARRLR